MFKLVVVDHSFVDKTLRKRWRLLAQRHPVDVTLLVPKVWKSDWLGEEITYRPEQVSNDGYRVVPLPTTTKRNWSKYFFFSHDAKFRSINPDHIHIQHSEMALIHHQLIPYQKLWAPDAAITFFSMNALGVPQNKWHQRVRWRHLKNNAAAALCHYPGCRDSLRDAGFDKPIFQQTSYGIDEGLFRPDRDKRETIREELDIDSSFVVGYVGRLSEDKGVDDLLEALPLEGIDWSLLLVGDGGMTDEIKRIVAQNGWEDRVILTGYMPKEEVSKYLNAMDIFVLASKTQDYWIDTFPRSIVEAMATEVPVIGSDSGAIPFQIGDAGLIYPEGNVAELRSKIQKLAQDRELREELGQRGRKQSVSRFGQRALADGFYKIIKKMNGGAIEPDTE